MADKLSKNNRQSKQPEKNTTAQKDQKNNQDLRKDQDSEDDFVLIAPKSKKRPHRPPLELSDSD